MERCSRPIDWWCDLCKTSVCQKCSKGECAASAAHSLKDFDKIYHEVKVKFVRWRDECEEMFLVLEHRQKKLMTVIREKEKEVSEAHADSHSTQGNRMVEIGQLLNKLEPLSKQVEDLRRNLAAYGDRVDKLNRPDFFSVINDLLERLSLSASSSVEPQASRRNGALAAKPLGLHFIAEHQTKYSSRCFTVNHTKSGDVLMGCSEALEILSRERGEVFHMQYYSGAMAVEYKAEVFVSTRGIFPLLVDMQEVYKFNTYSRASELMFAFPTKSKLPAFISVSDEYIACVDMNNNNLKLYERKSRTLTDKQLSGFKAIRNLLFLPDGCLLVTGWNGAKEILSKFRLNEDGEPSLIWSCDDVFGGCGIAVADNGLIYVSRIKNKTIYVITSQGQRWTDITHDNLPEFYEDINIKGDELAVAGWDDRVVLLFRIV